MAVDRRKPVGFLYIEQPTCRRFGSVCATAQHNAVSLTFASFWACAVRSQDHNRMRENAMTTKTRKPALTLTRGQFEAAGKALNDAPELPAEQQPVTMREGIASIRDSIEAAKARGYSMDRIAEMLSAAGLVITSATLATYARPSQRVRSGSKARTAKKAAGTKTDNEG
jgi:hypothetical protein